jgi:hypothetical protein
VDVGPVGRSAVQRVVHPFSAFGMTDTEREHSVPPLALLV